jgi:CRP-like cAMP-binding protein
VPQFILSGWASLASILPDGRRQIYRIFVAGDVIGLPAHAACEEGSITALTACSTLVAAVLGEALSLDGKTALQAALTAAEREHLRLIHSGNLRLGRLTAYERTAHFLIEIADRLKAAGAGDGRRFPLPLTQEVLADVLGLSIVHTNRVLQQLRRDGLIELRSGVAVLLDRDRLSSIARGEVQSSRTRIEHGSAALTPTAS